MIATPRAYRRTPYLMLAPFFAVFAIFVAWPLIQSIVLATQRTYGPGVTRFVGIENFRLLLDDPMFWTALRNTTYFTLGSVLLQLPLSLGLALALNNPRVRCRGLFRLAFFSPVLVGMVFVAMMFSLLLQKRHGLVNVALHDLLDAFGVFSWTNLTHADVLDFPWTEQYTMWALILAALWMFVGYNMVYFLAALQNVRKDLMEAATIDGAGPIARFLHVTLPAIRPIGGFVVLLSIIGSFQLFELPWVMFGGPGWDNRGLTIVMYLYQSGFETGDLGYASAIGWMLALVLVSVAIVQYLLARRDEGAME